MRKLGFILLIGLWTGFSSPLSADPLKDAVDDTEVVQEETRPQNEAARDIDDDRAAFVYSPLNFAIDISGTWFTYSQYDLDDTGNLITGKSGGVRISFEWLPITTVGKLAVGVGLGFTTVSGLTVNGTASASVLSLPADVFVGYRLDLIRDQILVPYAKVGLEYTVTSQTSSNGGGRVGTPTYSGLQYILGGALCLNRLEPQTSKMLDAKMGINNTYLFFEYLNASPLGGPAFPNLARDEYRLGLRSEF